MNCRICGNTDGNIEYQARELLYGTNETFKYIECEKCECVQIADIPQNMKDYYPDNYHGFGFSKRYNPISNYLKIARNEYAVFGKNLIGKFLYNRNPQEALLSLRTINPKKSWRILDVGCGGGVLLYYLKELGFENVLGVDPFIEKDIIYNNGLKIVKKYLFEIEEEWDLIMFHHSFEHINEQKEILLKVGELLGKNGICLIRIPVVSSFAWKNYRLNWIQFDAPRHFYLHSLKSFSLLAEQSKLKLTKVKYDSSDLQFWGSEQYLKNISFFSPNSYYLNKKENIFSKKQISNFKKQAIELNNNNDGDQAIFILKKTNKGKS